MAGRFLEICTFVDVRTLHPVSLEACLTPTQTKESTHSHLARMQCECTYTRERPAHLSSSLHVDLRGETKGLRKSRANVRTTSAKKRPKKNVLLVSRDRREWVEEKGSRGDDTRRPLEPLSKRVDTDGSACSETRDRRRWKCTGSAESNDKREIQTCTDTTADIQGLGVACRLSFL